MKCSGENVILGGIFHVVSCFPQYFVLYGVNLDYFSDSVCIPSVAAYQIFQQGPEGPKKAWVSIFRSICTRGSKKWLSGKTPMV